jgi:hypothetical protein
MKRYRLFIISILIAAIVVVVKYTLHQLDWEIIALSSLHTSMVAGTIFVIGFLLSSTMSDYKESERIPPDFAANIENMYEDALSIHETYPDFDLKTFQKQLEKIAAAFAHDVRHKTKRSHLQIHNLSKHFAEMEKANIPPNFIVKLKQQQALLTKHLMRITYIQRIIFIPSATILAWSIVILTITLITFTEIEPFYGGMILTAGITFILAYILQLIRVIRTPFHTAGKTQDDVSLFLIDQTVEHLKKAR